MRSPWSGRAPECQGVASQLVVGRFSGKYVARHARRVERQRVRPVAGPGVHVVFEPSDVALSRARGRGAVCSEGAKDAQRVSGAFSDEGVEEGVGGVQVCHAAVPVVPVD